jgi:2-hydroxychromene-2-carboxylate isomerase
MCRQPILYFDLGSPYAYLAAERAETVLGTRPDFEPILVGGIFALRGHGSWAHTPERAERIADIEERATRYELPPMRWPTGWPNDTLKAMRAAIWAKKRDAGQRFALAAFRQAFVEGRDLSRLEVLEEVASAIDLPDDELASAIEEPALKEELKRATSSAWESGVVGVPCLRVEDDVFYGDDRLELAAERLGSGR